MQWQGQEILGIFFQKEDIFTAHYGMIMEKPCVQYKYIKIRPQKEFHPKLQNFCWPLTVCNVNPLQSYFDRQEMELFCKKNPL